MYSQPAVLFWDVDTQVDFIHQSGALAVPGAEAITSNLARLTRAALEHDVPVVASADDHQASDDEISDQPDFATTYPPHCMHGTPGQEKIRETTIAGARVIGHQDLSETEIARQVREAGPALVILKKRFDVFSNPNTEKVLAALRPQRIVLYGVATDVCNNAAVEGLLARGHTHLTVVTDAIRALDEDQVDDLLDAWQSRGVTLRTTDEVLADLPAPVPT